MCLSLWCISRPSLVFWGISKICLMYFWIIRLSLWWISRLSVIYRCISIVLFFHYPKYFWTYLICFYVFPWSLVFLLSDVFPYFPLFWCISEILFPSLSEIFLDYSIVSLMYCQILFYFLRYFQNLSDVFPDVSPPIWCIPWYYVNHINANC